MRRTTSIGLAAWSKRYSPAWRTRVWLATRASRKSQRERTTPAFTRASAMPPAKYGQRNLCVLKYTDWRPGLDKFLSIEGSSDPWIQSGGGCLRMDSDSREGAK